MTVRSWQPRKRIRLDASVYALPGALCSITIAVKSRRPVFGNDAIASAAVAVLQGLANRHCLSVHAFCIMPDHVHLLLEPSETCDIVTFLGQFKNLVLRAAWKLGVQGTFWQPSFWDHFLRSDEDIGVVTQYILNNPVRAGLADTVDEYPYSGACTLT